jgi:hypothetical protein
MKNPGNPASLISSPPLLTLVAAAAAACRNIFVAVRAYLLYLEEGEWGNLPSVYPCFSVYMLARRSSSSFAAETLPPS